MPGTTSYVECAGCGLTRQEPVPSPEHIPDLYPAFYGTPLRQGDTIPVDRIDVPVHRHRARVIDGIRPVPGRLLDIGSGSGFWMEFMRRRGWRPAGIEPAPELVEYAAEVLGLPDIINTAWPTDRELPWRPDVISMFHLIEHVPDPVGTLAQAGKALAEDGLLVLETPNLGSLAMALFGKRCTQWDAPRHICLFTVRTLARCLEAAGFEMVLSHTYSPTLTEYTESLRYLARDLHLRRYDDGPSGADPPLPAAASGPPADLPAGGGEPPSAGRALRLFHGLEHLGFRALDTAARAAGMGCNLLAAARRRSA